MDCVDRFIDSISIDSEDYIVVACSGGPDSMFLLHLLWEKNYKIVCAHVNHKVRKISDDEYEFVKKYCEDHNIIFEGTEINEYSDDNFHDYARNFRYNYFESILKKYNSNLLFTAHHGDDLIETILMRLVRGSSLKGYAGFRSIVKKDNYRIIRPLIFLTKNEIEEKAKELNIPYVIDESNLEDHYTRNRYRHVVLPFLKSEEPNVHTKFLNFSNTIYEVSDYLNREVNKYKEEMYHNNVLNLKEFIKLDRLIERLLLESIISDWYPDDLFLINNNHIDAIFKMINNDKKNATLALPSNVYVIREYDKLIITRDNKAFEDIDVIFNDIYESEIGTIKIVDDSTDNSNYTIRLNSKDIKLPLHIINRTDGLKMNVKNMVGSKKINDIFIDMKISKSKRDIWPILVDDEDKVIWIPGLKKSNLDVVNCKDYDIIITCVKKEENI